MNGVQTLKRSLLVLLVLVASTIGVQAQSFASFTPAQPCVSDTVTLTYGRQGPVIANLNVTWYVYLAPGSAQNTTLYGDTVKHLFDSVGTYDVWYDAWDSTSGLRDSGFLSIFIDSICADNAITGVVYDDANGNGAQDGGETGIANKRVILQPDNYSTYTDANGEYEILVRPGSYTVEVEVPNYYTLTQPSGAGNYPVTFAASGGSSAGNDFGLEVLANVRDLRVTLTGWFVRPGFATSYWLNYRNVGTTTEDITITFDHDANLTFDQSTPAEDSYSGNTLTYTVTGVAPGDAGSYLVEFDAPAPPDMEIGDVLVHYANIEPSANDTVPGDNADTLIQTVVGSFDPNDKAVFPAGDGADGRILPVKTLTYLVRFQNTGTFLAEDVRVEDTLDANLDILSVRTIETSHAYNLSIDNATGAIVWYFDGIMLPDSNANEPLSHGFINFEVDVIDWENVATGTEINNTAYIYFDFNAAVITNTTRTTFDKTLGIGAAPQELETSRLYPNPVHEMAIIEFNNDGRAYTVRVLDISGREVIVTPETTSTRTELNVNNLSKGMYLYEIVTSGATVSKGKFMINK